MYALCDNPWFFQSTIQSQVYRPNWRIRLYPLQSNIKTKTKMKKKHVIFLCVGQFMYKIRLISRADLFISSVIKKRNIFARTCEYVCKCVPTSVVIPTTISYQCQFKFRLLFARWMKKEEGLIVIRKQRENKLSLALFYLKRECAKRIACRILQILKREFVRHFFSICVRKNNSKVLAFYWFFFTFNELTKKCNYVR